MNYDTESPGTPGVESAFEPYDPNADPFVNTTENLSLYNKLKFIFPGLILIPIRLILGLTTLFLCAVVCTIAMMGVPKSKQPKPIKGWRRAISAPTLRWSARILAFSMGFHRIKVTGKIAGRKEAPIIVCNHAAAWEGFALLWTCGVTFLSRSENGKIPLLGACMRAQQCLFVNRDNSQSRTYVVDEVRRRSQEDGWPQLVIFPEGTTINQRVLLAFRTGAFQPGVPVQPVVVRYPFKHLDPTFSGHKVGLGALVLRVLSQFYNSMELTYLPVYTPSEEEKANPQLFADNVRAVMAKAGAINVSEYNVEDYFLTNQAVKMGIPPQDAVVGMERLRRVLHLGVSDVTETMKLFKDMDMRRKGEVSYEDFCKSLGMPDSPALRATYSKIAGNSKTLNFRQFLETTSQHSKGLTAEEQIKFVFEVVNVKGDGKLSLDELSAMMLLLSPDTNDEQAESLFKKIDTRRVGYIDYLQLGTFLRSHPNYMALFEQARTEQREKKINPVLEMLARRAEGKPMTVEEFRQRVLEQHDKDKKTQ